MSLSDGETSKGTNFIVPEEAEEEVDLKPVRFFFWRFQIHCRRGMSRALPHGLQPAWPAITTRAKITSATKFTCDSKEGIKKAT